MQKDFSSNVIGTKFGRGATLQIEWKCLCGNLNKRYLVRCYVCNLEKSLALEVQAKMRGKNE